MVAIGVGGWGEERRGRGERKSSNESEIALVEPGQVQLMTLHTTYTAGTAHDPTHNIQCHVQAHMHTGQAQADRHRVIQTDTRRQTHVDTDTLTHTDSHTQIGTLTQTDSHTHTDRLTHTDSHTHTDIHTHTHR